MVRGRRKKYSRRPTAGEWMVGIFLVILSLVCFAGGLWGLAYLLENWWFGRTWELGVLILALAVAGSIFSGAGYYFLVTKPRRRLLETASEILSGCGPDQAADQACREPKID
ncbi:MAG: hypothetical protein ACOZHQ_00970 [Thermodesulfobacteriota bacterium]